MCVKAEKSINPHIRNVRAGGSIPLIGSIKTKAYSHKAVSLFYWCYAGDTHFQKTSHFRQSPSTHFGLTVISRCMSWMQPLGLISGRQMPVAIIGWRFMPRHGIVWEVLGPVLPRLIIGIIAQI